MSEERPGYAEQVNKWTVVSQPESYFTDLEEGFIDSDFEALAGPDADTHWSTFQANNLGEALDHVEALGLIAEGYRIRALFWSAALTKDEDIRMDKESLAEYHEAAEASKLAKSSNQNI